MVVNAITYVLRVEVIESANLSSHFFLYDFHDCLPWLRIQSADEIDNR